MAKKPSVNAQIAALKRQIAQLRVQTAEASEFRLVDKSGRARAILEISRSGPRLAMSHEDGTTALELTLSTEGPSLRLADERGKTRLFLGATRDAARIGLADATGKQRAFIGVSRGGKPTLTIYDARQRAVWSAPR